MSMSDIQTSDELLRGSSDEYAKEREAQIPEFVKTNPDYYLKQFRKIGANSAFTWTFNLWAGILGPVWFCARSMWNWGLSFLLLEIFAIVQIVRGLFVG